MFKEDYKEQLDNLTVSEDFKAQTIDLMQQRAARLGQTEPVIHKEEKVIKFNFKKVARVCACMAVCALSIWAVKLNSAKLNSAEMPVEVPEASGYSTKQATPPEAAATGEAVNNQIALAGEMGKNSFACDDAGVTSDDDSRIVFIGENGIEYKYSYSVYSPDGKNYIQLLANRENISYNEAVAFYKNNVKDSTDMLVVQVG